MADNNSKVKKQIQGNYEEQAKFNSLLHRIFVQNKDGEQLLEYWKHDLLMNPEVNGGKDLFSLGFTLGQKDFIRKILTHIQLAESK